MSKGVTEMANLTFTLRASLPMVDDDAPEETRAAVTAHIAAILRAVADQVEREGVSGMWTNASPAEGVPATFLYDEDGYNRASFALKLPTSGRSDDVLPGPACPPAPSVLPELRAGQLMGELDALMHAVQCVFPEDVINAANEIIQETGAWSHANVGQAYATARNRDILREYMTAYQFSDEQARRVYARALANNMRKVTK